MEAAIKREQSHAMHELCRALGRLDGNHQERENIKKKESRPGMGEISLFYLQLNSSTLRSSR